MERYWGPAIISVLLVLVAFSGPSWFAYALMNQGYIEYTRGLMKYKDGENDQATQEFLYQTYLRAIEFEPALNNRASYRLLPLLMYGKPPEAKLDRICQRDRDGFLLIRLLRRAENFTKIRRYEEADLLYTWLSINCPASFEILVARAKYKEERGDYALAFELMGKAIALEPQLPPPDYRQGDQSRAIWRQVALARAHSDIGVLLYTENRYEEALEIIESSLEKYPPGTVSPWLYNLIGVISYTLGKLEKAEWAFEEGLKIKPDLPEASKYLQWIKEKRKSSSP